MTRHGQYTWSYGVTTVPKRFTDLLPRTLASLAKAGFDRPRLFIDGAGGEIELATALSGYSQTIHDPPLRTFGKWFASAWELYVREPNADYYAIFQDDMVTYPNLRRYLEKCIYPKLGYWNLYTFAVNEVKDKVGWYRSPTQQGLGAVALVFNNIAMRTLLASQYMVDRPLSASRGWKSVDGGIVCAFKAALKAPPEDQWAEFVHYPSLVQHTGIHSVMENNPHPLAPSFKGEGFDALELLCAVKD